MEPSVLFENGKIRACRLAVHNVSSIGSNDERDFGKEESNGKEYNM
jgi:hypothetical protein